MNYECLNFFISGCRAEMSQYTGYIRTPNVRYPPDTSPDYSRLITCEWIIKADGKLVTFETVSGITNVIDTTAGSNDKYEVSDISFHLPFQNHWATWATLKVHIVSTHWRNGDTYMYHWTGSSMVQIMNCWLHAIKPLTEQMLTCYWNHNNKFYIIEIRT